MILFLMVLVTTLVFASRAYAYLDPGTGSYILQILLSIILGGLFAFKLFFTKIKLFFKRIFTKKSNKK